MAKEDIVGEMTRDCLVMRTRLLARAVSNIYDDAYRPLGLNSAQFALLVVIAHLQPASRAEIGRFNQQDKSTLTRNLKLMLDAGWIEENADEVSGRRRPVQLTGAGNELLVEAEPAWRTAQRQAAELLGQDAFDGMIEIANGVMSAPSAHG